MKPTAPAHEIDYPESDGRPMGESDLHRDWMMRIFEVLRYRYREQQVYVASDLLVYYVEGDPRPGRLHHKSLAEQHFEEVIVIEGGQ